MCVCVCVCEREREKRGNVGREGKAGISPIRLALG